MRSRLWVVIGLLLAGGLGVWQFTRPRARAIQVVIGIDTSGSARPVLSRYVLEASRLTAHLEPEVDTLTLYRVDEATQEFYRDRVRGGREATLRRLLAEVARQPAHSSTFPVAFWRTALQRSPAADGPLLLVYFSDGDNDDMSSASKAALAQLGRELAERPSLVGVALVGVTTANRGYWINVFGAPLGDRLLLVGADEIRVDTILERLEQRRNF